MSSTVVRELITAGDMERATTMLGHPYMVIGSIIGGRLDIADEYKLLPCEGSYRAMVNGTERVVGVERRTLHLPCEYDCRAVVEFMGRV